MRTIVINSTSNGKHWEKQINGRPHLITSMVSIQLDSVMNNVLYPADEVRAAYPQLDNLPAPASHPVIDGKFVSANSPLATNAFNVGAFVTNPRLDGDLVLNDLAIDIAQAEKDPRGVRLMAAITNGEAVGVSTGLVAETLMKVNGESKGKPYDGIVGGITFDHVAFLLDETPAGDTTFTVNAADEDKVLECNLSDSVNDLRESVNDAAREKYSNDETHAYVLDLLMDPPRAVVEVCRSGTDRLIVLPYRLNENDSVVFTSEGEEVTRHIVYKPVGTSHDEGEDMDHKLFIMALIANASNSFTTADLPGLTAMDETALANALGGAAIAPGITTEQATIHLTDNGMHVASAEFDVDGYAAFQANADAFKAYQDAEKAKRQTVIDEIVANTEMAAEDLTDVSDAMLTNMAKSFTNTQDFSPQGGLTVVPRGDGSAAVDYG